MENEKLKVNFPAVFLALFFGGVGLVLAEIFWKEIIVFGVFIGVVALIAAIVTAAFTRGPVGNPFNRFP